jgi:hypothetical protein
MSKKVRPKRVWVYPEFHKMLKKKSADEGVDIIKLTEMLSKEESEKKSKKGLFEFGFKL